MHESQAGQQIPTIYILLNISWSKDNQIMKFCQLIEYNMRNIFLEKSYKKCGRKASLRPFYKKSKWSISLDQQSEHLYSLFLLYCHFEDYQNKLKLKYWSLAFNSFEAFFLKKKKRSGNSLSASFSAWFLKKYIFHTIFYKTNEILLSDCLYFLRYWVICVL